MIPFKIINKIFVRRLPASTGIIFSGRSIMQGVRKRKCAVPAEQAEKDQNIKVKIGSLETTETKLDDVHKEGIPNTDKGKKLSRQQFNKDGSSLAKYLLGRVIHRKLEDGSVLSGRIVETEAYLGEIDKACHTYGGKRTERTEAMYMQPGTSYVYFIYGMYFCLNISSSDKGGCVLIRALEALQENKWRTKPNMQKVWVDLITGHQEMQENRKAKRKTDNGKQIPVHMLCNGPSKLCTALNITRNELNKIDMATSSVFWVEEDSNFVDNQIITSTRIGIDSYGPEWAAKPLRFYLLANKAVSVRDKTAEIDFGKAKAV